MQKLSIAHQRADVIVSSDFSIILNSGPRANKRRAQTRAFETLGGRGARQIPERTCNILTDGRMVLPLFYVLIRLGFPRNFKKLNDESLLLFCQVL
jgi:hypothetical protein